MHNPGASRIPGSEGSSLTSGGGGTAGADVGGTLRAGDTTSDADSYSNLARGMGEATAGINMPQGVTRPAASDNPPKGEGGVRTPTTGPSDATA